MKRRIIDEAPPLGGGVLFLVRSCDRETQMAFTRETFIKSLGRLPAVGEKFRLPMFGQAECECLEVAP